ncbi:hypothetical protein SAMN04488543_3607 [Friedmanniella luteola]|uniref:Uncharacterized protein n=1 Tax=Friedmanniella luteola TaxID=546871 RepID=A0A1H1Z7C3_9ACTN|nr:hypothetical protein [Friedmanniella luteola]SDT29608.1 hypothetical protein SAMN04488543_3607 [Friedmanniella luteola]
MLEWATFGAAAVAALGTFLGPLVAYRSVTGTAAATRLQSDVDRYISFALEPDAVTCRLGIAQLQYLLNAGDLSQSQLNAVSEAITAGLRRLQEEMEADPDAVVALEVGAGDLVPGGLDGTGDTGGADRGEGAP